MNREIRPRRRQPDFVRKAGPHRDRKGEERRTERKAKHKARFCAWED